MDTTPSFNPTRVRLKLSAIFPARSRSYGFNPTRVRLKLDVTIHLKTDDRELQPHEGSSETRFGVVDLVFVLVASTPRGFV